MVDELKDGWMLVWETAPQGLMGAEVMSISKLRCLPALLVLIALAALPVRAATVDFALINNGYLDPQELQLVGTAQQNGTAVSLTSEADFNSAGALYLNQRISTTWFQADFDFRITPGQGLGEEASADGLTFAIARSPAALGQTGPGLGYQGIDASSFAVEFDTYNNGVPDFNDPDGNHIGIDLHGSVNSIVTQSIPSPLDDGQLHHATITYANTVQGGHVVVALDHQVWLDLTDARIEVPDGYLGFTAATGGATAQHRIETFRLLTATPASTPRASFSSKSVLGSTHSPAAHLKGSVSVSRTGRVGGSVNLNYQAPHGPRLSIVPLSLVAAPDGSATIYGFSQHGLFQQFIRIDVRDLKRLDPVRVMLDNGAPPDQWQVLQGGVHVSPGRQ